MVDSFANLQIHESHLSQFSPIQLLVLQTLFKLLLSSFSLTPSLFYLAYWTVCVVSSRVLISALIQQNGCV